MPKTRAALEKLRSVGIDEICEKYSAGQTIRDLADEYGVSKSVLHRFVSMHENAEQWEAAKKAAAALYAEECLEIADESSRDLVVDGNGNERVNHEVVNRSKLRVETRKWIAGKLDPAGYGEQKGGVTVNIASVHLDVLRALRPAVVEGVVSGRKDGVATPLQGEA